MERKIQVWFVGAGPGDPELLTVKAAKLLAKAQTVIYAGSLVPKSLLAGAPSEARLIDSAPLTLEETHAAIVQSVQEKRLTVRLHTGDPALYGAVREQTELLDKEGITWAVVPGISAAFAAAAEAKIFFTVPELCQSLILTRLEGRTPVPPKEDLELLAAHNCAMGIYLSGAAAPALQAKLQHAGLPPNTPIVIAHKVGWPEQLIIHTTLGELPACASQLELTTQVVFLVLPANKAKEQRSCLYDPAFSHAWRK